MHPKTVAKTFLPLSVACVDAVPDRNRGAMPLRSGAPSGYQHAINKLNAARRHANDCPEEIFSGKSAGTRRGGISKDRPMVCRSTAGCGRWVIRLDSAAFQRRVSSGFVMDGRGTRRSDRGRCFRCNHVGTPCRRTGYVAGGTTTGFQRSTARNCRRSIDTRASFARASRGLDRLSVLRHEMPPRDRSPGIQRTGPHAINSPRPRSTRERPSRFRPNSRRTGRSPPGSMHAARSGSWSWRSDTRSASDTRSCRLSRGPAR